MTSGSSHSEQFVLSTDSGLDLLPNLIVIGVQKAGSTWIHRRLQEHPDAFMTSEKETSFFLANRSETITEYLQRFEGGRNAVLRGESTPAYFWSPSTIDIANAHGNVPSVIRKICGTNIQLLLSFRDPVSRTISAYYHHFVAGRYDASMSVLDVMNRIGIIEMSRYSKHWAYWLQYFPEKVFRVSCLEDIATDPEASCAKLYASVGLARFNNPAAQKKENEGSVLVWDGEVLSISKIAKQRWHKKFEGVELPVVRKHEIDFLISELQAEYTFLNQFDLGRTYTPTIESVLESISTG